MDARIPDALAALKRGQIILVYDSPGREGETDMVVASEFVSHEIIRTLRTDAGGLICATLPSALWETIGIPFMADILAASTQDYPVLAGLVPSAMPYDRRSSFSLTVNHVDTYTGITDEDRATTISKLSDFVRRALAAENGWAPEVFGQEFRAPGHVFLLNAAPGLMEERRGHTELVTALMLMAGLTPTATICEMLGPHGRALSVEEAKEYARRHDTVFLRGTEIVEAWGQWSG
jgi:3,4-dihydroxy 2-butanone 4-phosphate synthase